MNRKYIKFGLASGIILLSLAYLGFTGVQESKSYYVTIKELRAMDSSVYEKRLRVAGNVESGSIKRNGTRVQFTLLEEGLALPVVYNGSEAPPDTFVDNAQALAEGRMGRDGVFQAKHLQAKCASKYAPQEQQKPGATPAPTSGPATQRTENRQGAPASGSY
ncbi:MAG TPA: cytochrome c maturation protein CcmE [Terriglobales bacterium]|nr:cytochrome c maturation protein CcmE [Terriglobales bacterium]